MYISAFLIIEYVRVMLEKEGISSLKVFGILHASAWIAQFIGHGIFESNFLLILCVYVYRKSTSPFR